MKRFSILRRRQLSRRTLLRGAGCAMALPWLDAMAPGLSAPASPMRSVFVFSPNGKVMEDWRPEGSKSGPRFDLPFLLEPLAPVRHRLGVFTGLDLDGGRSHGDGPGDHARAAASFLTTAHPFKTGGADICAGRSVDQVMAASVAADATSLRSLELGMDPGRSAGTVSYTHLTLPTKRIV